METELIDRAFDSGRTLKSGSVQVTMKCQEMGDILLPTGAIVACDPIYLYDLDPFVHQIAPGRYSVVLSIAEARHSGIQRIAFAMLRVTDEASVSWQLATKARQHTRENEDDSAQGYGVDVALGSFMDMKAAELLRGKRNEDDRYHDYIFEQVERHSPNWANIMLDPATELNITVFSTGFGDGFYTSHWGYDDSGSIACLLTDFKLFLKQLRHLVVGRGDERIPAPIA